jgi:alpha-glucosidase
MTWPGAPTLYYGDEAGLAGWTDPDNRRPYPWGKEDKQLMEAHIKLIALRKKYPVLRYGSTEYLRNDFGFISFGRWDDKNKIAVAINNNAEAADVELPVWKICAKGKMKRIAIIFDGRVSCDERPYAIIDGKVRVTVPGTGAIMLAQ